MSNEPFLTREQRFASDVFIQIKPLIPQATQSKDDQQEKYRKAYGSLAHKLPVLIRTAGLAQALSFVAARNAKDTPQYRLVADLEAVLRKGSLLAAGISLVERSRSAGFEEYMRLTEGALEALLWFKRFAQSELHVQSSVDDPEGANA